MKPLGYRVCTRCGKVEYLGTVEELAAETSRWFVKHLLMLPNGEQLKCTAAVYVSQEDPSTCVECDEKTYIGDIP